MIPRTALPKLLQLARSFPAVAIIGPRQSGKSTLAKMAFPHKRRVSLEPLDVRDFAQHDPRGFLGQFPEGAILDEVQRAPGLFSYLQEVIDEKNAPGHFILSGSQHFLLMESVSQTLAGRVAFLELLPFAREEVPRKFRPKTLEETLFKGGYPRIYDQRIEPTDWYPSYIRTYVERDVRELKRVTNLETFRRFLGLCAGRTGQLLNNSTLAADAGISHPTAIEWLNLLETSFIIHRLPPHFANFSKRITKTPKLHFIDTGLACSLLGIEHASQLTTHPLKGHLFESWAFGELLKQRFHRGQRSNLFYWRDQVGHEIDFLFDSGRKLYPFEAKSGKTFSTDMARELLYWTHLAGGSAGKGTVLYGGDSTFTRDGYDVSSWQNIQLPPLHGAQLPV